MANEAIPRYGPYEYADFTVADGTGIEKGTLLKLTDPRTAIASSAAGDVMAGIAAREKIASDGRTRLAVCRRGDFDLIASGAVLAGHPVMSAGHHNYVKLLSSGYSGASIIGYALETASDGEVIQVRVNL